MTETRTLDSKTCIDLEDRYAAHNYHPLDVVISRGEGCFVWDLEGKKYFDCLAAYSAVNQGHNHPRIVEALVEQAKVLALTSRAFRNDRFGPFCEKLSRFTGYDRVLMMNTGAEAVETAIKAMRKWGYSVKGVPEGKAHIIVFDGNFHGRTTTIVGFAGDEHDDRYFGPYSDGFTICKYGDLDSVKQVMAERSEHVVGILVEPVQGEGGVVVPPAEFLPGLRKLCDDHNALLIADEIQSGLGRAGSIFAHTLTGACADGVTIGKALSGGLYPVSAFLCRKEVMEVFTPGTHGSTYGGNPLACAVAEAAIDVLVDEDLIEKSKTLGAWFVDQLRAIGSKHIDEVRGAGLWAGVQLKPEAGGARKFCEELRDRGILCKETQTHTIRFAPPLVVTKDELEWALGEIRAVLG
ncbi:MAG: ornithine--oxo-acid transaminase [Planctomycetota bacterium]